DDRRQPHAKRRAATDFGVDIDTAAVLFDDAVYRREAQAGAARLGREERLEDAWQDLARNPAAGIADLEADVGLEARRRDRQRAAARHRVAAVDCEVDEHLVEHRRVGLDDDWFR